MIHTETKTLARVTRREGAVVPMHEHPNAQIATWRRFVLTNDAPLADSAPRPSRDVPEHSGDDHDLLTRDRKGWECAA
jgi:hypothetical protein